MLAFIVFAVLSALTTPNPSVAITTHAIEAKRAEITRTVVAPCKDPAESTAKRALEHYKTCDCFSNEAERQKTLDAIRLALQQTLARCDVQGLDALLAYIDQREAEVRSKLREAIRTFQAQSSSFTSWGSSAASGEKEAQDKIGQLIVSQSLGAMVDNIIDMNEEELTKRLDGVVSHAESLRDVRRVRTGDLKQFVLALKSELAGMSKAQAKEFVLDELREAQLAVKDAALVEKRVSAGVIDASIPRDNDPSAEEKTQAYLAGGYATLLTDIRVLANHGVKDAKMFSAAAGILAFAPDAIDAAAILYNASAIGDNVSGLDSLSNAAEQQRAALSAEMTTLVAQRRVVSGERVRAKQAAGL